MKQIVAFFLILFCVCYFSLSCRRGKPICSSLSKYDWYIQGEQIHKFAPVYARGFTMEKQSGYTLITLKNPWHPSKNLQRYILVPKNQPLPAYLPKGIVLRTPLERIVVFSSVACSMLNELDVLSALVGVTEPEYIRIPNIRTGCAAGMIRNVGRASQLDIEQLMLIAPEAIITNPVNETGTGALAKMGTPTIPCLEWMETHPLGQAEWLRLIGLLFDKQELADSLFFSTVRSYNELKAMTDTVIIRPSVFTEKRYGDFWYMPGGKSYFAHLLADAGSYYVFGDNEDVGSIPFTFESVLDKAEGADFWLFKYYNIKKLTYRQLIDEFPFYALFNAYKKHRIYVCNTQHNPDYYQELPLHPDWLLWNLIKIFHPKLLPDGYERYYFKLSEI